MSEMSGTRLRDFATRYTAAWCSQEPASVAAFFDPSGSLTINGGTPSVGRVAITEAAQGFMSAFPDMKVFMDGLLEKGDRVLYRWTLDGSNTGPGGTGKRVRVSGYEDWRFAADGLVAESLGHFDADEYGRQVERGYEAESQREIRELVSRWMEASRAGDVDTVLSLMTDDVVFLVPGQPVMRKPDFEAAARSQAGANAPKIDGASDIQEIQVLDDWAFLWSRLTVTMTPPGGIPGTRAGHTLSVVRKQDGRWRVARDANMLAPVSR